MGYVESTLLPGEQVVYQAKVHWAVYLRPAFLALLGVFILSREDGQGAATLFGLLFLLAALIALVISAVQHLTTEVAITNKRVVAKFGLVQRRTFEPQLGQIEGAYLEQSVLGRMLGYGDLIVKGTGGGGSPIPFIADPLTFRNTLAPLLA